MARRSLNHAPTAADLPIRGRGRTLFMLLRLGWIAGWSTAAGTGPTWRSTRRNANESAAGKDEGEEHGTHSQRSSAMQTPSSVARDRSWRRGLKQDGQPLGDAQQPSATSSSRVPSSFKPLDDGVRSQNRRPVSVDAWMQRWGAAEKGGIQRGRVDSDASGSAAVGTLELQHDQSSKCKNLQLEGVSSLAGLLMELSKHSIALSDTPGSLPTVAARDLGAAAMLAERLLRAATRLQRGGAEGADDQAEPRAATAAGSNAEAALSVIAAHLARHLVNEHGGAAGTRDSEENEEDTTEVTEVDVLHALQQVTSKSDGNLLSLNLTISVPQVLVGWRITTRGLCSSSRQYILCGDRPSRAAAKRGLRASTGGTYLLPSCRCASFLVCGCQRVLTISS